jgi:hypothetical protein
MKHIKIDKDFEIITDGIFKMQCSRWFQKSTNPMDWGIWIGGYDKSSHLNKEEVSNLVKYLNNWLDTGSFNVNKESTMQTYDNKIIDKISNVIANKTPQRGEYWYRDLTMEILDVLSQHNMLRIVDESPTGD